MAIIKSSSERIRVKQPGSNILEPAHAWRVRQQEQQGDDDEIPFVPAYDLLEAQRSILTHEEVALIALAIHLSSPRTDSTNSPWKLIAQLEGVSQRL